MFNNKKYRLVVIGTGKSGSEILRKALKSNQFEVVGVFTNPQSKKKGLDLGQVLGLPSVIGITAQSSSQLTKKLLDLYADVVIDFSTPEASISNAAAVSRLGIPMVIGTTGFDDAQLEKLKRLAGKSTGCIVVAPNLSDGINEMILLSKIAAIINNRPHINIHDNHHAAKHDVPSGTARLLSRELGVLSEQFGKSCEVTTTSVRAGNHPSEHTVSFIGQYDKLEISTTVFSPDAFILNALEIASLAVGKTGFLSVWDLIGFTALETAINDFLQQLKLAKPHENAA